MMTEIPTAKAVPIGIKPKIFQDEQRYEELYDCIMRYLKADEEVNKDWLTELMDLHYSIYSHMIEKGFRPIIISLPIDRLFIELMASIETRNRDKA